MSANRNPLRLILAVTACALLAQPAHAQKGGFVLISKDQEIQIGRESAAAVEKEFGIYRELPALNAYVERVGQRLVAQCGRRDITYRFTVLDTPVINAFALPGGFVYVTRGILARMNSEDELATVMGHELAHVALRHGAQEISRQTVAQLGIQALSIFKPDLAKSVGQYAGTALNLAFLGYSRDLEAQADEYGITYAEAAGYNPRGATKMFQMLQSIEQGEPGAMEKFLASHPPTAQRLTYAEGRVGQYTKEHPKKAEQPLMRDELLRQLNGLALGNAKGEAIVSGGTYVNKVYRIGFDFPDTYQADLTPDDPDALAIFVRRMKGSGGRVTQRVIGIEGKVLQQPRAPEDYAQRYLANLKVQHKVVEYARVSAAGISAPANVVDVQTQGGAARLLMAFVVRDRTALVIYGFTDPADFAQSRPEFEGMMRTLRFAPDRELASAQPARLRLVTARPGDSWTTLAVQNLAAPNGGARLAAYNGIFRPDKPPEPGMLVKIPDKAALKEKAGGAG
jgi:predicted Zn-dependent protease